MYEVNPTLTLFALGVGGLVELGVRDKALIGVCDSDSVLLLFEFPLLTPTTEQNIKKCTPITIANELDTYCFKDGNSFTSLL